MLASLKLFFIKLNRWGRLKDRIWRDEVQDQGPEREVNFNKKRQKLWVKRMARCETKLRSRMIICHGTAYCHGSPGVLAWKIQSDSCVEQLSFHQDTSAACMTTICIPTAFRSTYWSSSAHFACRAALVEHQKEGEKCHWLRPWTDTSSDR